MDKYFARALLPYLQACINDDNKKSKTFDEDLFAKAQVVLLRLVPKKNPRVFFVENQSRKNDTQTVLNFALPKNFKLPTKAKEISYKSFKRMAG